MQYTQVVFRYDFPADYLSDLFLQGLADIGFETFSEDEAYIQTGLLDEEELRHYVSSFNSQYRAHVAILQVEACADENWNATWESEHPIMHLPEGVCIVPHCAFGAGYHATTNMLIHKLLAMRPLTGMRVLDNGCGTGVLGIYAAKLGGQVVAIDIDEKSVANSLENAALNGVSLDVRLGSTPPEGPYELILSNIHRNILLEQMPAYAHNLTPGGTLLISGFYASDVEPLLSAGEQHQLTHLQTYQEEEWCMMEFRKNTTV